MAGLKLILGGLLLFVAWFSISDSYSVLNDWYRSMLDVDQDGVVTQEELVRFVGLLDEGDEEMLRREVSVLWKMLNIDGNEVIEEWELQKLLGETYDSPSRYIDDATPEQVHLSLTSKPSEMVVVWVTWTQTNSSLVTYGTQSGNYGSTQSGEIYTYDAGFFGWDGWLHKVRLVNLNPGTVYYYKVGDGSTWSPEFHFTTAPGGFVDGLRYNVFGDMGTFMPFGFVVTNAMVETHNQNNYDMTLHLGDISYAGTSSTREWQIIWDIWGRQVERLAAYMPYMTTLGNHEKYFNFTSFKARLPMQGEESGGLDNYYYSFDYGGVHFVQTCSEAYAAPYETGSVQYEWLRNDLAKAVLNRENVPWIIVTGHRPMYGSTTDGAWEDIRAHLEPLLKEFNVDMFLCGHIHAYERTHPVYDHNVVKYETPIISKPPHPVHVTIGTAGAMVWEKWTFPKPEWSAFRQARYGYAHFEVTNKTTLHFQYFNGYVRGEGELADEFWIVK